MRPHVLFLTPRIPYPLVGGDRVKANHLLRLLAQRYRVTCVTFVEGPANRDAERAIRALGVDLRVVPLHRWAAIARVAGTILSDHPLEVQYYWHSRFRDEVLRIAATDHVDLVMSFFMRTAEYARLVAGVPRMLIAEDARMLLQERATQRPRLHPGFLMRSVERRKLARYEPWIVDAFDLTTYVSAADERAILDINPAARTAIVTNGVDLEEFPFSDDADRRKGIVFAGRMDVMHNILMALTVGREIYPRLHEQSPELTCTIVGKNPSRAVRRLARFGVTVTGEVPHVSEYVSRSAVFVHPQIVGAGIQNKVLEAMALGTPVVSTPVGLNGIAVRDGVDALVCRSVDELVGATRRLLDSPALRRTLARNARALVERDHSWSVVGRQLDDAIARCCGPTAAMSPVETTEAVV